MPDEKPNDATASIEDAQTLVNEAREAFVRELQIVNRWPPNPTEQMVLLAAFNNGLQVFMIGTMQFVNEQPEHEERGEPPYPFNIDATEEVRPMLRTSHRELCCGVFKGEPHDSTCPETGGK